MILYIYLSNDLIGLSIPKQPVSNNNYIVESRIMIYNNQLIRLYICKDTYIYMTYIITHLFKYQIKYSKYIK